MACLLVEIVFKFPHLGGKYTKVSGEDLIFSSCKESFEQFAARLTPSPWTGNAHLLAEWICFWINKTDILVILNSKLNADIFVRYDTLA